MKKWLTIIGEAILKGSEIVGHLVGLGAFPGGDRLQGELEKIADIIIDVEAAGQALKLDGMQKLTAAAPLVAQIILKAEKLDGHENHEQALFTQGVTKIASGMADVLNSRKS